MMSIKCGVILALFSLFCVSDCAQITDVYWNNLGSGFNQDAIVYARSSYQTVPNKYYAKQPEARETQPEKVTLQIFYECLCPDCRDLDSKQLLPLIQKIGYFVDIHTYPYGNAKTNTDPGGHYFFNCQHGPKECYGNKLHACVLDTLKNHTEAVLFNICMMDYSQTGGGSDDAAADVCGRAMGLDTASIKQCAKGERGTQLLKYYGDQSQKANFNYVPYILINGKVSNGDDLMKDVCSAFKNPPGVCKAFYTY